MCGRARAPGVCACRRVFSGGGSESQAAACRRACFQLPPQHIWLCLADTTKGRQEPVRGAPPIKRRVPKTRSHADLKSAGRGGVRGGIGAD